MSTLLAEVGLLSYDTYLRRFERWVKEGSTSSELATVEKIEFTKLNLSRTQRIHNTLILDDVLKAEARRIKHNYTWVVLTEAWCGDSAQNLPVIAEIARLNPQKIKLYILFRDKNTEFMNNYLTNGARAIPKLICIDETLSRESFVWGPRPAAAQKLLTEWKKDPGGKNWNEFERDLHTWYAKNKSQDIQKEFAILLHTLV